MIQKEEPPRFFLLDQVNSLDCTYTQRVEVNGRTLVESLSERRARSTQGRKRATALDISCTRPKVGEEQIFSSLSPLKRMGTCMQHLYLCVNGHKTCCDGWTSCASTCSADSVVSNSQTSSEAVVS